MALKDYKAITFSFLAADVTEVKVTINEPIIPGFTHTVVVAVANFTNPITVTYKHYTPDTALIFSISGLPENMPIATPNVLLYERPIFSGCVIGILPSGAPGSTGDVTVKIYSKV